MKNYLLISIVLVLFVAGVGFLYFERNKILRVQTVNEAEAIEAIKSKFPELRDYPSDSLPPKSIRVEKSEEGWYVAFVQEGSGVPVISAQCFLLGVDGEISARECKITGDNVGGGKDDFNCALETCHGINNVTCGSNPPEACTAMYEIGDKCLQYVKCAIKDGKCGEIQNAQFAACKSCTQRCIEENKSDSVKMFECESKCG